MTRIISNQNLPKAYSYLRFSTPAQMEGDSFRRQTSLAERYAKDNGLELDRSLKFHDLGVSAYRGANADTGRLADFKEAVKAGLVPTGSFLLVESLDRLSRLTPRKALRGLEDIIELDIKVVTLNDGKIYTPSSLDTDQISLIMAIIYFMRANEESVTKGRRIRAAWEGKRLQAHQHPLTASCPAWMTLNKVEGVFVVDDAKASILKRIFLELQQGSGLESVTKRLNQEGVQPFGKGKMWYRSYVQKIRDNPAVVGTFIPHQEEHSSLGKKRLPLEPLLNYYPAVIEMEMFLEVQAIAQGKSPSAKVAHGIKSILAGLAICPQCSGSMTRVTKGAGSKAGKPYLVCTAAKQGKGCQYKAVRQEDVEHALISGLDAVLGEVPLPNAEEQARRDNIVASQAVLEDEIVSMLNAITAKPLPSLLTRLEELESNLEATKAELGRIDAADQTGDYGLVLSRVTSFATNLKEVSSDVTQMNVYLRQLFKCVIVNYKYGRLELEWKQGGWSTIGYAWVS